LTVQKEGGRNVKRNIQLYNLDVIISVGYRVKSQRGTEFRIWATNILKTYLLKGFVFHNRLEVLEQKVSKLQYQNKHFDFLLKTTLPPSEGIFYDGQVYDAWKFVSDLIKTANESIILIDNYVDDSVLTLLTKRTAGVKASLYTNNISKELSLDCEKYNKQYEPVELKTFSKSHDRFLIIDCKTVYHIGASLKDLGKKWFAFSRIELDAQSLIDKLQ
jgi:hypothetical protein